jgi:hypothetical protein
MKCKLSVQTVSIYPHGDEGITDLKLEFNVPKGLSFDARCELLFAEQTKLHNVIAAAVEAAGYKITKNNC